MRIVSPYKPMTTPDKHHTPERVGAFDWIDALRMLAATAARFDYEVIALTDTMLAVPHISLPTKHSALMTWIIEVSLLYLESDHFDRDSVFLSPDSLINAPLPDLGNSDLGICARHAPKYKDKPILNCVQLWPVASKEKLIRFYRDCLEISEGIGGKWGGDTLPLTQLLSPVIQGDAQRHGLTVRFFSHHSLLHTINGTDILALDSGKTPLHTAAPIIDFKSTKKRYMRNYYRAIYENR